MKSTNYEEKRDKVDRKTTISKMIGDLFIKEGGNAQYCGMPYVYEPEIPSDILLSTTKRLPN